MNAKDSSKVQDYIDSLAESSSSGSDGIAEIVADINLGNDIRLTLIKTDSGAYHCHLVFDNEAGDELAGELTTYPVPESSSSSSSS